MASGQLTFTDLGGNSLRISAGSCLLRADDDEALKLVEYQLATQDVTIPADTGRYVGVQYNSGSPNFVVKTTDTWNNNSDFRVCQCYNEGGTIHIFARLMRSHNLQYWITHRFEEVEGLSRADVVGGLILADSADNNRYVTMSEGEMYIGLEEFDVAAFDSSGAATFDVYYRDGGSGWTKVAAQSTWNNSHYDDDSGTLEPLSTPAKFAVNWYYLETDGDIVMLYGQGEYATLTGALSETPPASVPGRLALHGVLLGSIAFQNTDTIAQEVVTSFSTTYGPSSVTNHHSLGGLGDDDHNQYVAWAGRTGGQAIYGGTAAAETLWLDGTAHATEGDVKIGRSAPLWVEAGANSQTLVVDAASKVGILTSTPATALDVNGNITCDELVSDTTSVAEGVTAGKAFLGNWQAGATFGVLCHVDQKADALKYAVLMNATGQVYLNSSTDLSFRIGNINQMVLSTGGLTMSSSWLNMNGYDIVGVDDITGNGGSIFSGGSGASEALYLKGTTHGTPGPVNIGENSQFVVEAGAAANTLVVDSNSRVGIGTATPTALLELYRLTGNTDITLQADGANSTVGINFINDVETWSMQVNGGAADNFQILDGAVACFQIEPGTGADTLVLDSNSRVGIGTAAPLQHFHIKGAGAQYAQIETTAAAAAGFYLTTTGRTWLFYISGAFGDPLIITDSTAGTNPFWIEAAAPTNSIRIDADGGVGMGAAPASASEKLAVTSTTAGFVLPRMTAVQRGNIVAPVNGMMVYDTTNNAIYGYENGGWVDI